MAKVKRKAAEEAAPEKLHQHVYRWRGYAWAPGAHDCCTFVAEWAMAKTGFDFMAEWRDLYGSDEDGEKLLADCGGLDAIFEQYREQHGDVQNVCTVKFPNGIQTAGLTDGDRVHIYTPKGVSSFHVTAAVRRCMRFYF